MMTYCPDCKKGVRYCTFNGILWVEKCTNCKFQTAHHNRRKEQKRIKFPDRRSKECDSI